MANRYMVKPLEKEEIPRAFPLVQSVSPHLTLGHWVDYAQSLYGPARQNSGAGIMSARNPQGYIFGIYCHVMEPDIESGRVLRVSNFAAANLSDSGSILDPLIVSMSLVAREHGCGAVRIDLPEAMRNWPRPVQGVFNAFKAAGYKVKTVDLVHTLDGT